VRVLDAQIENVLDAQIETYWMRRLKTGLEIHVLPGVFAYQNKKFVTSQLFGVLRKY
jgi:hypothetical protein